MSELVTGEAVALELRPAKLPSRALAVLIDLVVAWAVYLGVTVAIVASTSSLDDAAAAAIAVATFVLILVGGPIAVETLSHGRSLGKMACGLRVVRDDGGPIRFRHALVRGAVGVVEILLTFGVVACIASLVSARGRRLGDVFAGTLVVRERVPAGRAAFVPPPPPWLAGRFSGLDLSGVPEGLWLAIRQYLTRMGQLDAQVGWAMAERLAGDLAARTGAPAPQGFRRPRTWPPWCRSGRLVMRGGRSVGVRLVRGMRRRRALRGTRGVFCRRLPSLPRFTLRTRLSRLPRPVRWSGRKLLRPRLRARGSCRPRRARFR